MTALVVVSLQRYAAFQGLVDARDLRAAADEAEVSKGRGQERAKGVQVVATAIDGADAQSLREAVDSLKGRLGSAVIVLGTVTEEGKVSLVAGVTPDLTQKIRAGDLVGEISKIVGGRGGGRPDFAQAGGTDPSKLEAALAAVEPLVAEKL